MSIYFYTLSKQKQVCRVRGFILVDQKKMFQSEIARSLLADWYKLWEVSNCASNQLVRLIYMANKLRTAINHIYGNKPHLKKKELRFSRQVFEVSVVKVVEQLAFDVHAAPINTVDHSLCKGKGIMTHTRNKFKRRSSNIEYRATHFHVSKYLDRKWIS